MDTAGGDRLGRFWASVAGLELRPDTEGDGDLIGPSEGHGIALCVVPEPKSVKHRVHLDVYAAAVADLEALGATVVLPSEESGHAWTVMHDPEGGEFCAFLKSPEELPSYRIHGLVVDSADPRAIAEWWAGVLGARLEGGEDKGWWWLEDISGMPITTMDFVPVPEPKTAKNRIHWDVYGSVETLRARGATLLRAADRPTASDGPKEAGSISWHVMADPEGNEFCVFER